MDYALAGAFAAFALVEELLVRMPGWWWPYVLVVAAALVAARRVLPLSGLVFAIATSLPYFAGREEVTFRLWQVVAMMISAYTLGSLFPPPGRDRATRLRAGAGAALLAAQALSYWTLDPTDPMAAFLFPAAPYGLGIAVAAQARRLGEAAEAQAAVRERQARAAVTEERVRLARELHDLVAHSVTVMVVQAGAVRRRLDAGLPVDPELLRGIEEAGRDAVGELRRTLGLLRGEGAPDAPAGLDRLDELVAQVREAGLAVTVRRTGEPVPLLPAVDVSAYRIVQEALTNVLKHAGPASVTVGIGYGPRGLELTVEDDGRPAAAPHGGGQGLIGMRERVGMFGGELSAGPRDGGGFAVRARLPVAAVASR
ncbi:hypothetical protein Sya03_47940 [Spirilliplanes yamanashiensis]|uniref:histidine kinase n=2 Tax=Spirilliplanes yamanashiensis TaxID=42233 RepID=A0A8J4DKL8_9ACTN|nr:hypothetical protein Sya03_47940 [Spirilliplanes yamanashiensis]